MSRFRRNWKPLNTKSFYDESDLRHQDFNDRVPPPRNPIFLAKLDNRPHKNDATGSTLFHQNLMPVGMYAGTHLMERIPHDYLRRVVLQWGKDPSVFPGPRESWQAVVEYVERCEWYITETEDGKTPDNRQQTLRGDSDKDSRSKTSRFKTTNPNPN
jgi:hypothetical protein